MRPNKFPKFQSVTKAILSKSALLMALLAAPAAVHAQTTLFGAPSNFDVYNDTGQPAYGFEIELQLFQDHLGIAHRHGKLQRARNSIQSECHAIER